jgi:TonB family protein
MRPSRPPVVATWLLEHFRSGSTNDCITGDLIEAYQGGCSRAWYWKQVLAAIIVSFYSRGSYMTRQIKRFTFGSVIALTIALCVFIALRNNSNRAYYPGVGGVGFPSCKYCPKPTYSESALKAKYEGNVLLEAVITAEGHASKIRVVKGPDQGLGVEEKAIETLGRWRFNPAQGPAGKPVAVRVPIEVAFHLPASK